MTDQKKKKKPNGAKKIEKKKTKEDRGKEKRFKTQGNGRTIGTDVKLREEGEETEKCKLN